MIDLPLIARRQLIKDYKLPIPIVDSPYWEYFVNLYGDYHNIHNKIVMIKTLLSNAKHKGTTEKEMSGEVIHKAVEFIKDTPSYQHYNTMDLTKYTSAKVNFNSRSIYHPEFDGKRFMSFDLVKANFHVMRAFDSELVGDHLTWENFLIDFTHECYHYRSKQLRQVIFGCCNPSRQQRMQRYYIALLSKELEQFFPIDYFMQASADELIVQLPRPKAWTEVDECVRNFAAKHEMPIRISRFTLHQLKPHNFYVRKFINSEKDWDIKNVPLTFFAQAFKHVTGQTVNDNDLVFYHEKQFARFIEPLNFEKGEFWL